MRILFVRHGESEHNVGKSKDYDSLLTSRGRKQAAALGRRLKKEKISVIYTSNLKRTKETGKIVSKMIGVPIKANFEELNEYSPRVILNFLGRFSEVGRRRKLKKWVRELKKRREKDETVLIVAHGITNRILMSYFMGFPLRKSLVCLTQNNTCINVLEWNKVYKNWNLNSMNDSAHVGGLIRSQK
jgi:broad specificity phosphatase PhoE